ncbi:unnamed protein product [Pleuronectes platessa]|uniref:Uncharacterized protein n=1 Tax=Pleuronectes platessa TaxID=8262 RepID=A0A9N7VHD0_PLEPL|nr:unnamed protein product [Pleuronectes platessa]
MRFLPVVAYVAFKHGVGCGEGERPGSHKGEPHSFALFIFSHNIHYNGSMGQGEARTLVGEGAPRNNKQMFFDDNCSEGKRSVEGGPPQSAHLLRLSLLPAAPPEALWWYVV